MATPRYTTRQELPYLVEKGRDTVLSCPVYAGDALSAPTLSGSSITVYDESNTAIVNAQAVTIVGSIAEYTIPAALTTSRNPSSGWRVEWTLAGLSGAPGPQVFRSSAYLVRYRLFPTIAGADIGKRIPALATSFAGRPTTATTYSDAIEEADTEVQRRLIVNQRRPWLIVEPWVLREAWLTLAIAIVYEGLAAVSTEEGPYMERAKYYRQLFEDAFGTASSSMDWDQDGSADSTKRTPARPGVVWTS